MYPCELNNTSKRYHDISIYVTTIHLGLQLTPLYLSGRDLITWYIFITDCGYKFSYWRIGGLHLYFIGNATIQYKLMWIFYFPVGYVTLVCVFPLDTGEIFITYNYKIK